ncbi:MAG TPA: hypothetical protein VGR05_02540 [Sphingomicrobium sp.]|nr:hypothetical protein [Sphingomicrobium sp.]
MRSRRHLSSDYIWEHLWERIQSQIGLAGGLKGDRRNSAREADGVPVDPNRPNSLSGGAAAALEFDD